MNKCLKKVINKTLIVNFYSIKYFDETEVNIFIEYFFFSFKLNVTIKRQFMSSISHWNLLQINNNKVRNMYSSFKKLLYYKNDHIY